MTGRRITAVRTAAGAVTVATLLTTTSACGMFGSGSSKSPADAKHTSAGAGASSSAQATPQSVAQAFLAAWSSGDFAAAAALTDDAKSASARLKDIAGSLSPKKVTLTLGTQENVAAGADASSPSGSSSGASSAPASSGSSPSSSSSSAATPLARYSFTVTDDFGNNLVWTYQSALNLVPGPSGTPVVQWNSAVIHPQLGPTALLKAVVKQTVVDATGNPIDLTAFPTLAPAMNALATRVPANTTPTQLTVEFVDPKTGSQIPRSNAWPLGTASGPAPKVKTTIDPRVQRAIQSALAHYPNSGMVAIQPSTGNILGMASNDPSYTSLAYKATRAPGSTFKVITTALALQRGLQFGQPVDCSPTATVEGQVINNDSSLRNGIPNATLKDAFEQSCNTAFVHLALDGKLGTDYSALSNEAKTYFGMNQKWDLGMGPATYGTSGDQQVPPADGQGLFARDAFGQGDIEMSPLTMASVAATVCQGQFKQPILVQGAPQISAQPLSPGVDSQLTALMKGVISDSEGTAYAGLDGRPIFPHNIGLAGKTGSAETSGTAKTDSWMIVFDKAHDIAFGALVVNGGFGIQGAGPAINQALSSLGYE